MKSNDSVFDRLVDLLDNNFGYVFEEKAEDVAERIIKSGIFHAARGKWVEMFDHDEYPARNHWFCCSVCGHIAPFGRMSDTELHTNFCPNCGADMREDSQKETEDA